MTPRPRLADEFDDPVGPAALPRNNGELFFAEPWEARAFGIAVSLYEAGHFDWAEFRSRLIEHIATAGRSDGSDYYRHWLAALEDLISSRQMLTGKMIKDRVASIAQADRHA